MILANGLLVLVLLCWVMTAFAQDMKLNNDVEDDADNAKPWQETTLTFPAPPKDANLAEFYLGPTSTAKSAVDIKSLSVSTDGVVRYTLVTKSSGGALNVSYEGIRCATGEHKSYAYGRADGTWIPARNNQWKRIVDVGANRQTAALYKDYFCNGIIISGTAEQIGARLRDQRPLDPSRF